MYGQQNIKIVKSGSISCDKSKLGEGNHALPPNVAV